MSALGSLVVKLALEYAQYTQGLNKADQEALKFAKNVQKNVDSVKDAVTDMAKNVIGGFLAFETAAAAVEKVGAAIERMDKIDNLSQRIGIARGELQELAHYARLSDTNLEGLATGTKKLSVLMTEAAGGSEEAQAKLKAIGVSATDTNGKLRSSSDVMADIADKFAGMEDGAGKTALAIQIFGKSGTDLIPMLNGGGKAMREAREEAKKFGMVMSDESIAAAAAFGDSLDRLKSISEGTFNQIADASLPVLNIFAEAMVDSASGTDSLNASAQRLNKDGSLREWAIDAAKVIGFVVDAGQGVYRVFEIIGKTIGAAAAQAVALMTGDLKGAAQIGKEWAADVDGILNRELFSAKLNARLSELNSTLKASEEQSKKRAAPVADANAGKEKEKLSDYQKFTLAINERLAVLSQESTMTEALSEDEKLALKILVELRDGKKKLTDEEKRGLSTSLEALIIAGKEADSQKIVKKNYEELLKSRKDERDAVQKSIDATQAEIDNFGKLPSAITDATVARLEEKKATLMLAGAYGAEIDQIDELIAANKRLANLQGDKERLDREKKAADDALKEWKKTADQIEDKLTDALMRGFESGKDAAANLRDAVVNMFKTLVLRPIVQAIVQTGTNGIMGDSSGSGGGGIMQTASNLYKLYSNAKDMFSGAWSLGGSIGGGVSAFGSMAGSSSISAFGSGMGMSTGAASEAAGIYNAAGMGSTGSALTAGSYVGAAANIVGGIAGGVYGGRAISNGYGSNGAVNTGVAIGAAVGSIIPVIGTALGALVGGLLGGLYNRAFGYKAKEVTSFGVQGDFGADGSFNNAQNYTNWKQAGGWFRSDKSGTEYATLETEIADAYKQGFKALKDSSRGFADALGLSADSIDSYSKSIKLELTKDDAENQKRIAEMFGGMANEIANTLIPNIAEFAKKGEDAGTTLQRLATTAQTVDGFFELLGRDVDAAFGAVGLGAVKAKQRIIDLAGGMEGFAAQSNFFAANFLTEAERMAPVIKAVGDKMTELGQANVKTVPQFAALVKSIDMSSEAGQNLYAALMAIAPAFLQVANFANASAQSSASRQLEIEIMRLSGNEIGAVAAERAAELAALDPALRAMKERVYALQDAAANEEKWKSIVGDARSALTEAYDRESGALNETIDKFRQFSKSLRDFRDSLLTGDMSTLSPEQQYQELKGRFERTYALALSGDPEAMGKLEGVSNEFLQASKAYYASSEAYASDFARVREALGNAANSADAQVSIAQQQLAKLDQQVSGLIQINTSVLSVQQAIANLSSAIMGAHSSGATGAISGGSSGGGYSGAAAAYTSAFNSAVSAYGDKYGGNAYYFVKGINDYEARKESVETTGARLGMGWEELTGHSEAYWQEVQRQWDAGLHPTETSVTGFALGAVFTNGVVSQPTNFDIGQMGEAGYPEAIVPLVKTSGGLGVRMTGGVDIEPVVKVLNQVVTELRAANLQRGVVAIDQSSKLDGVADSLDTLHRQLARA